MRKIYYHQVNNAIKEMIETTSSSKGLRGLSPSFILTKGERLKPQLPKSFMVVIRPLSTRLTKPSLRIDFKMDSFLLEFGERHFPLFKIVLISSALVLRSLHWRLHRRNFIQQRGTQSFYYFSQFFSSSSKIYLGNFRNFAGFSRYQSLYQWQRFTY